MQARKVPPHHQLQYQISISSIVLLPPPCELSNRGGMSDPRLILQLFQQLLEPGRVATAFTSYYYFLATELFIKGSYHILYMLQLHLPNLTIFSCQITGRLFASMKVDSDIYSHGRLLLLTQTVTVSLTTLG